ncbi:MAG TPA: peptidoglycan DD-metalloendopeptidase family protein [Candidatus Caccousia avicola]|uniref:Peptidoglycan DD-metalloendopeptidase family protein n=1 Tax=Candidatus Caccousia avicola TaxID=2840721 RepID=A0A9D1AKC4_9FIRM|nr:peptidoglycan DD-metalloendopeptidase family protein [Candidatus Caccousia avicola]
MGGNAKLKGKFWKRLGKPFLALVLAVCVAQGTGGSAIAATLTELQQEQARLEQEKKENDAKLAELKADQSKQQEYKNTLDAQMQNLQSQIDGLNTQINDLDASISEKNAAIAEKQENIDRDVETLKERLCAIYMMGDASTLEIILQSESVIDMAQKVELLNMITEHDTRMIQQLSADMEAIADEKAEIESQKEEVAAARTQLEAKGSELASVQAEAERVLEELNQSVESVQAESDRIAKEKAQASAEIDQWWKDYYAQQAAQNNGSSGGSSGSSGSGGYVSTGNFTWPVPGFTNISCGYSSGHKAIDISGGGRTIYGTPIVAADSGKVVTATYHYSYGNYVMIDHGGGYSTLYAHASSLAVSAGQTVTKGQTIAYVGSTGNSTGPHLHFEVRVNGNRQNPFNWFS